MFGRLEDILQNTLSLDVGEAMRFAYKSDALKLFTVDLNRIEQLFKKGIDSKGKSLGFYSPFTIRRKKAEGLPYDHITLLDTRVFYQSFVLKPKQNYLEFDADPIKDETNLFEKYGVDVLGLTDNSIEKLAPRLATKFATYARKKILGESVNGS